MSIKLENKSNRSTLVNFDEIEFNMDAERISFTNVMASDHIQDTIKLTHNFGASVIHGFIDVDELVDSGYKLIESQIKDLIGSILAQQGFIVEGQLILDYYEALVDITKNGLKAHGLLHKIFQAQSGKLYQDVNSKYLAPMFFGVNAYFNTWTSENLNANDIPDGTLCNNERFSNVEWMAKFVSPLKRVYTTPTMRAMVQKLFAPVFELNQGTTDKTSYVNLWLKDYNSDYTSSTFQTLCANINLIINGKPSMPVILAALGFQGGSEFDFTRPLDQKVLPLAYDDVLVEHLLGISPLANIDGETEKVLSSYLFANDDTPVSTSSMASLNRISLLNAIRGSVVFDYLFQYKRRKNGGVWVDTVIKQRTALNIFVRLGQSPTAGEIELADRINLLHRQQLGVIDFDVTHQIYAYTEPVPGQPNFGLIKFERIEIQGGYGTYKIDPSSQQLAKDASMTALLFGASYEEEFTTKMNKLPQNVIKTT